MTVDAPAKLRDRVVAPLSTPVPVSTPEVVWRPATKSDVDAILECARAIDVVEHPRYLTTREELEEELGHSYVSLDADSLVALDAQGHVLAYGLTVLNPGQETIVQSLLIGGVRPSARGTGLGRHLLAWQEARALQHFAGSDKSLPGWMIVWSYERVPETVRLAERSGFAIARYYLELHRDLTEPIVPLELEGFEVVAFDDSLSEAVRLARNDSFRDHWGSQPSTQERWSGVVSRTVFRPDLSFIALAPNGEVAGFVLSEVNEDDFDAQGFSGAYIELVGVPRAYRGRGIAPALLTHTLQAMKSAGLEKAILDVDAENPTGALGLYSRVGFAESDRSLQLNKVF